MQFEKKLNEKQYSVTWTRYYILVLYGLILYASNICRDSNRKLKDLQVDLYNFDSTSMKYYGLIYQLVFLPGSIISTIVYNKYSLRTGIVSAA